MFVLIILLICLANIVDSDICQSKTFDRIYTKMITESDKHSLVVIVTDGHNQYLWNLEQNSVGLPTVENSDIDTVAGVHISSIPTKCTSNMKVCNELKKFKDLIISFKYSKTTKKYVYQYSKAKRDELHDVPVDKWQLPFNQSTNGNPTVPSKFDIWPNDWITGPNPCIAYHSIDNELIYISNPNKTGEMTTIYRINVFPEGYPWKGTAKFDVAVLNLTKNIIGLFEYHSGNYRKLYAVSDDLQVFEISETHSFTQIDKSFRQLIGCTDGEESTNGLTYVLSILFGIIIFLMIVFCLIFICYKVVVAPNYGKTSKHSSDEYKSMATRRTQDVQTELQTVMTVDSQTGKPIHEANN